MPPSVIAAAGATPPETSRWAVVQPWVATVVRAGLAAAWLWAGLAKIGDPAASVRAVRAYRVLPEWLDKGVGYGLPFVEIALAILLIAGIATRLSAVVSAAVLVVFIAGMISAAARNLQIDCGCFGGGGSLANGQHTAYTVDILRDIGLLLASVALAVWPRSRLAADDAVRAAGVRGPEPVRVGPRRTREAERRLAELAERRRQEGERRVRVLSTLAAVVLVAVAGAGIAIQAARASQPAGPAPQSIDVSSGIHVGSAHPKIVIELYEDFQCPICRQFEQTAGPVLSQAIASGQVQVHYHVIAFLDRASTAQYSTRAANAGYCAADAGVFEKLHDLLFANQPPENSAGLTDDQLIALGSQAGATSNTFVQCVRTGKYKSFVANATDQSSKDGIQGTPTVLVNGTQLPQNTGAALQAAINKALTGT